MKKLLLTLVCALAVSSAWAEEKTTTVKTTTTTGTLSEYVPGTTFIVKETSGPVKYTYGKTVTYVTKSGKVLTDDVVKTRIKVGVPVTVHYASEGETRVVSRVIIDDEKE